MEHHCLCGWRFVVNRSYSLKCPICGLINDISVEGGDVPPDPFQKLAYLRGLWKELHEYNPSEWNPESARAWFYNWLSRVPNYGCSCLSEFQKILQDHPPVFDSYVEFHQWTIYVHNLVNIKLNKPTWPYEAWK